METWRTDIASLLRDNPSLTVDHLHNPTFSSSPLFIYHDLSAFFSWLFHLSRSAQPPLPFFQFITVYAFFSLSCSFPLFPFFPIYSVLLHQPRSAMFRSSARISLVLRKILNYTQLPVVLSVWSCKRDQCRKSGLRSGLTRPRTRGGNLSLGSDLLRAPLDSEVVIFLLCCLWRVGRPFVGLAIKWSISCCLRLMCIGLWGGWKIGKRIFTFDLGSVLFLFCDIQ